MQLDDSVNILARLPIFAGMDGELLSTIAFSSERLLFRRGERLATDGRLGEAAYVILSGAAQIAEGTSDKRRLRLVGPGTMIGELAMLVEYTFASTVTASEETEVLELRRDMVHEMMRQFPAIQEHFSYRIHGRLARMAEDLRRYDRPSGATEAPREGEAAR